MVPEGALPEVYAIGDFHEYLFNADSLIIKHSLSKYQAQREKGVVYDAKFSKDKRYIVVMVVRDHKFARDGTFRDSRPRRSAGLRIRRVPRVGQAPQLR